MQGAPATVSMLSGGKVNINVNPDVNNFKIIFKSDADVVLTGDKNSGVEIEIADGNAKLTSNIPAKIDITADVGAPTIQLIEGSEGTEIKANSQEQIQNVENRTDEKISYEVKDNTSNDNKNDSDKNESNNSNFAV